MDNPDSERGSSCHGGRLELDTAARSQVSCSCISQQLQSYACFSVDTPLMQTTESACQYSLCLNDNTSSITADPLAFATAHTRGASVLPMLDMGLHGAHLPVNISSGAVRNGSY